MRERIYLMRGWYFSPKFSKEMIQEPPGGTLEIVDLPHTVKELPFHYFDESEYQMVSAYRYVLSGNPKWRGKKLLLTFEAVAHEARIYVNGEKLITHKNGYTAFTVDISQSIRYDEDNLITVIVDSRETLNQPPFGYVIDYMTYGGIYRDVYLEVCDPLYLADIFHIPALEECPETEGKTGAEIGTLQAPGTLQTEITFSEVKTGETPTIRQYLNDRLIYEGEPAIESSSEGEVRGKIEVRVGEVSLWDVESPTLYEVRTELYLGDSLKDTRVVSVGFREAVFRRNGFYLNGRRFKIRGLNRHQSFPYVGYAMPESIQREDARILKEELSLNAVRTSHYPQSHYFLEECDRRGLLVFTEFPGWQHIGDEAWKEQAVENVKEMVVQYRNHPSIILWGVRINESGDDDEFYRKTNEMAHRMDPTRQTGGVRAMKKSSLLEDVYTYNDFSHSGGNPGCEPKRKVTSDPDKAYMITEYNGHMFPTKTFDSEEHRCEHMLRHARVLDAVAGESDIAGSFGWCMADYNTHKDFGSGDRICYHGVLDMFRNPKLAASVYAAQGERPVLELSSTMDIGEHPACNRGDTYLVTNADSVRMYKNDELIKEYQRTDTAFGNLKSGPILLNDYVGDAIRKGEGFGEKQAKLVSYCLNQVAIHGMKMTPGLILAAARLVLRYRMKPEEAVGLYNKYVGDWGGASKEYRFEAVKDGKTVKVLRKSPMTRRKLTVLASSTELVENNTYDVAALRIQVTDENDNVLPFFQEPVSVTVEGPALVIGPSVIPLRGGMGGTYIRSQGITGQSATIRLSAEGCEPVEIIMKISNGRMR